MRSRKSTDSIAKILTIILFITYVAFSGYVFGIIHGENEYAKKAKELEERYRSAVFVTVDSNGAWIGSVPGAKEAPLYNNKGEQVGKLKEVSN